MVVPEIIISSILNGSTEGHVRDNRLVVENFIDGKFVSTASHLDSHNPASGQVWAKIPDSGEHEVNMAVSAAKAAFPMWSSLSAKQRSVYLMKIADVIEQHSEALAVAESYDQGKPVSLARAVDIPRAAYNMRFFASYILHHMGDCHHQSEFGCINYTGHEPVGVAGLISPWNLPLYLLTFKMAPAMAAGNTCVCKPSELTSVTAWLLCYLIQRYVDLPSGVINIVFGSGPAAGQQIAAHPAIPLVSFTGSTATGHSITLAAAKHCKKLSLELGGKNAGIIFDDIELDKCIPTIIRSCFANQGEICLCTSRLFVHRNIYPQFMDALTTAASGIVVGDPTQPGTVMGALVSKAHLDKVSRYVQVARDEGATVVQSVPSTALPAQGYYMAPTIISNISDMSVCMQEEIFGPVVCVVPFDTEEEVIARANAVEYGLCACVWTNRLGRAHRVAGKLKVGTVWINSWLVRDLNMPFGGTKHSGVGRESGKDSMDFYTEAKTVCVNVQ